MAPILLTLFAPPVQDYLIDNFAHDPAELAARVTVPILIIIVSLASNEFRWRGVLIASLVLTVFSWAIFVYGLKLTIPVWPRFLG